MLGLQVGLSQGRVKAWVQRLSPLVRAALSSLGLCPARDGQALADSDMALEGGADLLLDGSERRRQRPQAKTTQQEHYSGKKSPYRQNPRPRQQP